MKKYFIGIILLITLFYTKNVYAFEMGISTTEEYEGAISSEANQTVSIRPGAKNVVAMFFGDFWGENESITKFTMDVSVPSGVSIISTTAEGSSITGSNGNYTITPNAAPPDGIALITLQMPTPSQTTEYQVTVTGKSYSGESVSSTKTLSVKYIVLVKNTSCDDNDNVEITTSVGTPQKIGSFLGDQFALSTDADKATITITPASNKTKIYYGKDGTISDNMQYLPDNKISNYSLNYGENGFAFMIQTECSREWDQISQQISGNFSIGIDLSEYQRYPTYASLGITRNDTRSKVNTLNTLSITNVKINFNPDLKTYIATVPYEVSSVKISSTLKDSKSKYVDGYGNRTVNLNEGVNDVLVKVRAENGAEAVYTIKITRSPNEDATLKKLTINNKEIALKKDTLLYTMFVENDVTKLTIKADPTDEKAKVEISDVGELKEGINKVTITVTAASGAKKIYVVNVTRDKLISENSLLKDLTIKNHKISFNPNTFEYTITKNKGEDKLDITVETENDKATYVIIGNKKIKNGSTIKIKVTAQDKKTTTNYLIHIKEEKDNTIFLIVIIAGSILCIIGCFLMLIRKKKDKKIVEAPPLKEIPIEEKPVEEAKPTEEKQVETTPQVETPPQVELPSEGETTKEE